MLSRSASGPAGLSINTGAANNMFGSTTPSQPPPAGGLFGSSNQQSSNLFGSSTTTTSQPAQPTQPTQSVFGNTATPVQQQQQQGSELFGPNMAQTTQASRLFGSTPATQAQSSSGIFGSAPASHPQQTGGLFGSATTQPQQPKAGIFGSTTTQPAASGIFSGVAPQPPKPGGGLFGQSIAPAQGANSFSNLGQSTQQQPQGGSGGAFGHTLGARLGQSQQQVIPGVRIDVSNIKGTTRFNDLQEDLQKQIAFYDRVIQGYIKQKHDVDAFMPAHAEQLEAIPTDVSFVSRKYVGLDSAMSGDLHAIRQIRDLIKVDAEHATMSFAVMDNLTLPTAYHTTRQFGMNGASGAADKENETDQKLVGYFSKMADEMDEQIKKFQKNVKEIEMHLGGVQSTLMEQVQRVRANRNGVSGGSAEDQVAELAAVLRDFEESILHVAGTVGGAREGVTELQLSDFKGRSTNRAR